MAANPGKQRKLKYPILLAIVALSLVPTGSARADLILDFSSWGGETSVDADITVGWSFTTNQAITVDALDSTVLSVQSDESPAPMVVDLYDGSGDVLASAIVSSGDTVEGAPGPLFYTAAITPITLDANTTYYIAESENSASFYDLLNGLTTDPSITYGAGVSALGLHQVPTSDGFFDPSINPGYFGPDFDTSSSTTPEPGSMMLLVAGLLGIGVTRNLLKRN